MAGLVSFKMPAVLLIALLMCAVGVHFVPYCV